MSRIAEEPAKLNSKRNVSNDRTAFNESTSKRSVFIRNGEEQEQQLHEADKCNAKIHYLSRSVAREHGINPAVVLTGLAYKLKYHKCNRWKDRWWYYDPIEVLRTHRWPYLSDGCICENIEYLADQQLLIKDCNNKHSYDHTTWYAMDDKVRDATLSDLVWFDVAIAKKYKNVAPALIYHNLRYHLRELLKADSECQTPYHKLNKAMLARVLPMSESTAKRWIKTMLDDKIIVQHPKRRSLYTVADEHEYRANGSSSNAIGSSSNANRSNVNGSSSNAIGSFSNAIGSDVNAIGSNLNDNTQYETNQKPVRNHSEKGGCVVDDLSLDAKATADDDIRSNAMFVDHKDISDTVGSAPLRGKEETVAPSVSFSSFQMPKTFEQLFHHNKESENLLQRIDEDVRGFIQDYYQELCKSFVDDQLATSFIYELWGNNNQNVLLTHLSKSFADYVLAQIPGWHELPLSEDELWQLLYYPGLEIFVRAFADDDTQSTKLDHTMRFLRQTVLDTNWALRRKMHDEPSFGAEVKSDLFKETIVAHNKYGWILRDDSRQKNAVQPMSSAIKKIKEIFVLNPEITVSQLFHVLDCCVDVCCMDEAPSKGNDPEWHVRRATKLDKFVLWLEKIISELDLFDECPIQIFPTTEK